MCLNFNWIAIISLQYALKPFSFPCPIFKLSSAGRLISESSPLQIWFHAIICLLKENWLVFFAKMGNLTWKVSTQGYYYGLKLWIILIISWSPAFTCGYDKHMQLKVESMWWIPLYKHYALCLWQTTCITTDTHQLIHKLWHKQEARFWWVLVSLSLKS